MDSFALSERWNGWSRLDTMVAAARAAIASAPMNPVACEVTLEGDEDTVTLDNLTELDAPLAAGADPLSLEIIVAHAVEAQTRLRLVYNGRWLQIDVAGTEWTRAQGLRRRAGRARARVRDHDVQAARRTARRGLGGAARARRHRPGPGSPRARARTARASGLSAAGLLRGGQLARLVAGCEPLGIVSVPFGSPVIPSGGQRCG